MEHKSSVKKKYKAKSKSKSKAKKDKSKMGSVVSAADSARDFISKNIHKHSHEHKKNSKIQPLSEEALAVFCQFPTDVLEEIFVRAIDLPSNQLSASSWKMILQTCRQWRAISISNTFWYKATSLYFPEFIASSKHDPQVRFIKEFRRLACQLYDVKTMGITWLNEDYWKTITEEGIHTGKKNLPENTPSHIRPCDNMTLPNTHAYLASVCWFDVRTYAQVSYPCRATLLVCLRLGGGHLGPLNVDINAGIKNIADDEVKWHKLTGFVWTKELQSECPKNQWVYLDLGTVDVDHLNHGLETIELQGQIWSHTGDWKGGLSVSHLKCIQLPKH
jgi:hypothetical protein